MLQTGLDTNSVIGGARRLSAQMFAPATLQVDTVAGEFSFETVTNFNYFKIEYGTETPLGFELRADGSEAFLLTFSDVSMPGLWRGQSVLKVNGVSCEFLRELSAMHGSGAIRIPFSRFSTASTFLANQISVEAARVEYPYRLVLGSIVTVNADTPPVLSVAVQSDGNVQMLWSTNALGFVVQSTPLLGATPWHTLTDAVDVAGDHFSVTVHPPEAIGCFRLVRT